jgi:dihydroorotase-like cyclic amidohydrolase
VAFDPTAGWTVGERSFASRSRNSGFLGRGLRGRVMHTMFRGELVVREGEAAR